MLAALRRRRRRSHRRPPLRPAPAGFTPRRCFRIRPPRRRSRPSIAANSASSNFPVGAAIEPASITDAPTPTLLIKHFSSITAENAMKPDTIWPSAAGQHHAARGAPNFAPADLLVNFAQANNMQLRGHTLLWHQTVPPGSSPATRATPANYRATVQQRLRNYIFAVVQHFPKVYAWDVVNEVASDTQNCRESLSHRQPLVPAPTASAA